MTIKDLKLGEYFTLKPIAQPTERQVFIRGDYDRSDKRYEATRFDNIAISRLLEPDTPVYTDFVF